MRPVRAILSMIAFAAIVISTLTISSYAAEAPDRITAQIDTGHMLAVAKSLHPKAMPENDEGPVEPSFKMNYVTLLMSPSATQQNALDKLLAQQQDPKSANYHKWLTPSQYADRFGLSHADMNRVTGWLKSQGFQIVNIGGGRNFVVISGTAGQIQSAFATEIHRYRVLDEEHIANASPARMPAALNGVVTAVMGLHDFKARPANNPLTMRAMRNAHADYHDASFTEVFLAPGDLATIYDIGGLYTASFDGTGESLAVIGQTDIYLSDINDFRNGFTLTPYTCTTTTTGTVGLIKTCDTPNFKYVLVGTESGSVSSNDIGEADLDVEWSGAVARNAKIVYVNAPLTSGGVYDSLTTAISSNLAPVITLSYGNCELNSPNLETLLQQANTQGQTVLNSSGDVGSTTCDFNPTTQNRPFSPASNGLSVSYPASSPEVTGVGGTAITMANDGSATFWGGSNDPNGGSALKYVPEISWNDDEELAAFCVANSTQPFCNPSGGVKVTSAQTFQEDYWLSISGGGASNCFTENGSNQCTGGFPQPSWQQTLTVAAPAPAGVRWVPDVALMASPNFPGYIFCTPDTPSVDSSSCSGGILNAVNNLSVVGGTSASTPVFAGIVTLLNQFLGSRLGNINPKLYELAATSSNGAFNPVKTGDNNVFCLAGAPATQPAAIRCPGTLNSGVTETVGYNASNADATTGYNLVNGLGSVNANHLALAWAASLSSFTLGAAPGAVSVVAGHASAPVTVTVTPVGGFTGTVTYSCTGLPTDTTCSFNPASSTGGSAMTIHTGADTTVATKSVTVKGTSGGASATSPVSLTVTPTDQSFSLTSSSGTSTVTAGHNSAPITVTIHPVNGFTGTVSFTCTGPTGVTCNFVPTSVPLTSSTTTAVTIQTNAGAGALTGNVVITGASEGLTATSTIGLTVNATDQTFTLAPGVSTISVVQGASGNTSITMTAANGFNSALTYTCTSNAPESTCSIAPALQPTTVNPVTLNVSTTAPITQLSPPLGHASRIFYAALLPGLFGIFFSFGSKKRIARGGKLLSLIVILGCSTLWLSSCGGSATNSNKDPGTPAGSYTINVNATTGGGSPVTGATTITLTVTAR